MPAVQSLPVGIGGVFSMQLMRVLPLSHALLERLICEVAQKPCLLPSLTASLTNVRGEEWLLRQVNKACDCVLDRVAWLILTEMGLNLRCQNKTENKGLLHFVFSEIPGSANIWRRNGEEDSSGASAFCCKQEPWSYWGIFLVVVAVLFLDFDMSCLMFKMNSVFRMVKLWPKGRSGVQSRWRVQRESKQR